MPLAGLETSTGMEIYVAAGEPTDYTAANLALLTWELVVGTTGFGEWGDSENDVSEPTLAEGRVIHQNGTKDGGTVTIGVQYRDTDAGSDLLIANAGSNSLFTVLKKYAESGESEVATGVLSSPKYRSAEGGQDSIRGYTAQLMINTTIYPLSAADTTTALA